MTIQAQYWVHEPDRPPAEQVAELTTAEDVRDFVTLLADQHISDAILTHTKRPRIETAIPDENDPSAFLTVPDHSAIIGIHGERGAISYKGKDGHSTEPVQLYTRGQGPDQTVLYETEEFPPDCEVPTGALAEALIEFLETGRRPLSIRWQRGGEA
ncbi:Imm1 family immunity protein [Amycolatopsis sp. NPDC005232]|uniref:Imm1 family immunity protein n=1 Tax=Amycolatopsis sp. NPDC005232 TaxID=3157027 RepID=UPI0033BD5F00